MVKYENILIVDDDPVSNFISNLVLKKNNLANHIFVTEDAESGLIEYQQLEDDIDKLNLVLVDIRMPGKDGFRFIEELNICVQQKRGKTEVGILTNSNSEDDQMRMLELGAKYWINKPLKKEIVQDLSKSLIYSIV